MEAAIPKGEVHDSNFGAFAEAEAADAEKARAAKHYTAMAAEAAAMFEPRNREFWELYSAANASNDRYTSVVADRENYVRVNVGGLDCRESLGFRLTPAEARALAAELVKAAEALA